MLIKWRKGKTGLYDGYKVRKQVFVQEQKIPERLEIDEFDEIADHIIIYEKKSPIATGRFFFDGNKFKIGRICVVKHFRNNNYGTILIENLLKKAEENCIYEVHLDAQLIIINFYKKFGFVEYGNIFDDCGIDHISMKKILR